MASLNDNIAAAWKNDLAFLKIVCDLSGLAVALWRPGTSTAAGTSAAAEPAGVAEPAAAAEPAEPAFRWTSSPTGEHPRLCGEVLRKALEAYCRAERPGIFLKATTFFAVS